jgi:hypothetical protein
MIMNILVDIICLTSVHFILLKSAQEFYVVQKGVKNSLSPKIINEYDTSYL